MGGMDEVKKVIGKTLRAGAAGLMLSSAPVDAAPPGLTKPGSMPREFQDTDRLPPTPQIEDSKSGMHDPVSTPQFKSDDFYEPNYDYSWESKLATAEEKAALEKWYGENKATFAEIKKREMTAFQDFVTQMKACGTKRTDVQEDPVLQRRLSEANEIFVDAKSYHALFMWSWKLWNGEAPEKEVSEYEGGMDEYENSLRFGRSAAEAFGRLMREYPDTLEYLFDQTFCSTS